MKKTLIICSALALVFATQSCQKAPQGYYDESAIEALDQLTETIGNLSSLSVYTESDVTIDGKNKLRQSDVYLSGNNKMHVISRSADARKGFWFNGSELSVYNFDNNEYDQVAAPPTTLEMIDSVHHTFQVDFPAADFFYPTFTDDMMADFDTIVVVASEELDADGLQLRAVNAEKEVYLTVSKTTHLPSKLEIYTLANPEKDYYVALFTNWKLNPKIADNIFSFSPPEQAVKAQLFNAKK